MIALLIDFKVTKGMNKDIEEQSSQSNTAYELYNLKNQIYGGTSLNSLTNEVGTEKASLKIKALTELITELIDGTIIGVIPCGPTLATIFVKNTIKKLSLLLLESLLSQNARLVTLDLEDSSTTIKYTYLNSKGDIYYLTEVPINLEYTPINIPYKSGYIFKGWQLLSASLTEQIYTPMYIEDSSSSLNNIKVDFYIKNEYLSTSIVTTIENISLPRINCTNYSEDNWLIVEQTNNYIKYNYSTLTYSNAKSIQSRSSNIEGYKITYIDYYGIETTLTSLPGYTVYFPSVPNTIEDKTFLGWENYNTKELITSTYFTMPSAEITFKAVYKVLEYTITFQDYDDSIISTLKGIVGTSITLPLSPSRYGYIFMGWVPNVPSTIQNKNQIFRATYIMDDTVAPEENVEVDYIYRIEYTNDLAPLNVKLLALGLFGFGEYIEGLFVEENNILRKVYWIDGVNLLRYINIERTNIITEVNRLNMNPSFKLDHNFTVSKQIGGGTFTSGVIQYAFTYYIKNGPETGIVDMTPLYYVAEDTRGVAADETIGCSFKITILNPDTSFDYIRVYSILRTSLDGTPIVRIVKDIKLN